MLVELSIDMLGRGTRTSGDLAEILKIVDASGLRYILTPSGTCIEGDWGPVMEVVRHCHAKARSLTPHVVTTLRIEDQEGALDQLIGNVHMVEQAAGRLLGRLHPLPPDEPDAV
jgi:uncharacterized protein YqgV (UPF0045/DUF77 family)